MAVGSGVRTLLVWCPDWSVVAAEIVEGVPARAPVAVLHANRVVACSPAARAEGVVRGLRKREAQSRCPQLLVVEHDPGRDARAFEPVVVAVEQVVAEVAVVAPGACALEVRGVARFFGGEEFAAERVMEQVAQECGVEAQAGIADGVFAAGLAAKTGVIVPRGQTPQFLADIDVGALERPELADRLRRLGIGTLGEFAALPAGDVLTRFGFDAAWAHRLAGGAGGQPVAPRHPPPDLVVEQEYEEPLERVDVAAFAARALAQRLHERLAGHGVACTRLGIEAVTAHGQELSRSWRHDGLLSESAIADRVRWQLEGWLTGPGGRGRPRSGIRRLRLVPDGVVAQAGLQPGLWGESGAGRDRADRALARVQGLLGPDSVLAAVLRGGRSPADQVRLIPWGEPRVSDERACERISGRANAKRWPSGARPGAEPDAPWPGRLPAPAPATVLPEPEPVTVQDARGGPVSVSARLVVSAPPAWLVVEDDPPIQIVEWAGPWPADEHWWAPAEARRAARFQVQLADGRAQLLTLSGGEWTVEAVYD